MAKLRMEITKGDEIRFIAHLDYARAIERAIRRANLPAAYSEGFNPHMKIAFASALGVGVASNAEYVDIELKQEVAVNDVISQLGSKLPPGIRLKRAKYMPAASPALMATVNLAKYSVIAAISPEKDKAAIDLSVSNFNNAQEVHYTRQSPKGKREISVKEFVKQIETSVEKNELKINFACIITAKGTIKPSEVVEILVESFGLPIDKGSVSINRLGLYIADKGIQLSPLDLS